VVLYGSETWSLALREEHRLRVFENRVLRSIFETKKDLVTGGWRKLHNEKPRALHSSPTIIRNVKSRRMRWAGHVALMGRKGNMYKLLVGKLEGKETTRKTKMWWLDNINRDLVENGWCDVDWIGVAQDGDKWRALVNLRVI
jgi:hypothetical protein